MPDFDERFERQSPSLIWCDGTDPTLVHPARCLSETIPQDKLASGPLEMHGYLDLRAQCPERNSLSLLVLVLQFAAL